MKETPCQTTTKNSPHRRSPRAPNPPSSHPIHYRATLPQSIRRRPPDSKLTRTRRATPPTTESPHRSNCWGRKLSAVTSAVIRSVPAAGLVVVSHGIGVDGAQALFQFVRGAGRGWVGIGPAGGRAPGPAQVGNGGVLQPAGFAGCGAPCSSGPAPIGTGGLEQVGRPGTRPAVGERVSPRADAYYLTAARCPPATARQVGCSQAGRAGRRHPRTRQRLPRRGVQLHRSRRCTGRQTSPRPVLRPARPRRCHRP